MKTTEAEYEQNMKHRRRIFREAFRNPEVLAELKKHFQTDLPCFQGAAGSYDPLDAMRRDAYREVEAEAAGILTLPLRLAAPVWPTPCRIQTRLPPIHRLTRLRQIRSLGRPNLPPRRITCWPLTKRSLVTRRCRIY